MENDTISTARILLAVIFAAASGFQASAAEGGDARDSWQHRLSLRVVPPTPTDAYPLQVVLREPRFRHDQALSAGADLRFHGDEGAEFPYWLESWGVGGRSVVWGLVPRAGTTRLELRYGNPDAPPQSACAATFPAGTDFTDDHGFLFEEGGTREPFGDRSGSLRHGLFPVGAFWDVTHRVGGRLDAIAHLGGPVLLVGTRGNRPGHIFRSDDHGESWQDQGQFTPSEILNVLPIGRRRALFSTGKGEIFHSADGGRSWRLTARPSRFRMYSMARTSSGVVVASDTNPRGGHVFRSVDGGMTWVDLGAVSPDRVYRFESVGEGLLLNGWAGRVYKSLDDGRTWQDLGRLSPRPLCAIEHLGGGIALLGDERGHVFRSEDDGNTWRDLGDVGEAADDFVAMNDGTVVYTTYTGNKHLYRSDNHGRTWRSLGDTNVAGAFDHVIHVDEGGRAYGI